MEKVERVGKVWKVEEICRGHAQKISKRRSGIRIFRLVDKSSLEMVVITLGGLYFVHRIEVHFN